MAGSALAEPSAPTVAHLGDPVRDFRTPPPAAPRTSPERGAALGMIALEEERLSSEYVRGARLAVRLANETEGKGARPFSLEIGTVEGPWSTTAETGRDLLYEGDCLGILSPGSGEVAHLLAQIAIRGQVPLLCLSEESSLTRIPDPWVFRVVPDARARLGALLAALEPSLRELPLAAIVPPGRTGRLLREDLNSLGGEAGVEFDPILESGEFLAAGEVRIGPRRAVLLLTAQAETGEILARLSRSAWRGAVLLGAGPCVGENSLPGNLEVRSVRLFESEAPRAHHLEFARRFRETYGSPPSEAAACAYDAASLLITAIRHEGPNRSAIRDWLSSSEELHTLTGLSAFDGTGNRVGELKVTSRRPEQQNGGNYPEDSSQ